VKSTGHPFGVVVWARNSIPRSTDSKGLKIEFLESGKQRGLRYTELGRVYGERGAGDQGEGRRWVGEDVERESRGMLAREYRLVK